MLVFPPSKDVFFECSTVIRRTGHRGEIHGSVGQREAEGDGGMDAGQQHVGVE